jgi:hypothetical protein
MSDLDGYKPLEDRVTVFGTFGTTQESPTLSRIV